MPDHFFSTRASSCPSRSKAKVHGRHSGEETVSTTRPVASFTSNFFEKKAQRCCIAPSGLPSAALTSSR
jgi:hypothetical protein